MNIAVVILNYNSFENTKKCIQSFKKNENQKIKFHFIIVDNASNNNNEITRDLKNDGFNIVYDNYKYSNRNKSGDYCILLNKNLGYSYGNNIGLKLARAMKYKYAIVANPDTEVIEINAFADFSQIDKNFVAIFPKVFDSNNNIQSIYIYKNFIEEILGNVFYPIEIIVNRLKRKKIINRSYKTDIIKIDFSIGCFIFFNLDNFYKIGFFDENVFLYNEEKILMEKCKKNNIPIYYSDKLCIRHNHIYKEISEFAKKEGKKSKIYYYKEYKHYSQNVIKLILFSEKIKSFIYDRFIKCLKNYKNS